MPTVAFLYVTEYLHNRVVAAMDGEPANAKVG